MPAFCGVIGCGHRNERDNKSFHRLPALRTRGHATIKELSSLRRREWILALRRADLTETKIKYMWICGDHFISGKPAHILDIDNPDWVPSVKMGYSTSRKLSKIAKKWLSDIDRDFLQELIKLRKKNSESKPKGKTSSVSVTCNPIILSLRPAQDTSVHSSSAKTDEAVPESIAEVSTLHFSSTETDNGMPESLKSLHFRSTVTNAAIPVSPAKDSALHFSSSETDNEMPESLEETLLFISSLPKQMQQYL